MKNRIATRFVVALVLLLLGALSSAASEDLTGTRPGPPGQPLTINGTLFLLDVSKIDGADSSFTADVFLMLSWKDERLASEAEGIRRKSLSSIWSPQVQVLNQRRIWKTFPDTADISADGTVIHRQRYFGRFAAPLDLRDFPIDRQQLDIQVVIPGYGPDEIHFVPTTHDLGTGRSPDMTIPDWSIGSFEVRSEPYSAVPGGRELAALRGTFEARRYLGFYIGKALVSVAIIVFMSWVVFWVSPTQVGPRLSVSVTSMLTLIAYRFLLGQSLPPVSYLTRLDYFLLASTILVFIALIQVALTSSMEEGRGARVNRFSRWIFPVAFLLIFAVSFLVT